MQTALAVRETVLKFTDVFVYVLVYFTGTLILVGEAEIWLAWEQGNDIRVGRLGP